MPCVCVRSFVRSSETYLHLEADLPGDHAVAGAAAGPQVGEALHGEGGGAVAVPGHLEVQVAVVWKTRGTGSIKRHIHRELDA